MKYFLTVAEELHFGRAAERLHIAHQASDSATAVSFIAAGLRVTMVSESLSDLVRPAVLYLRVAGHGHTTDLVLVHCR